jgi:thymidylate synthase (FAD)
MTLTLEQQEQIDAHTAHHYQTRRATVAELESILYQSFPVLDHGFIRVIDYMGDDNAIVQAARVSYGTGTKTIREDKGLIRYLMRHRHTTPFEMCEIKFHIKLPIFVARQWIRHRTANINEYSARYSILDKEFYLPRIEHLASQSTHNHQGRSESETLSEEEARMVLDILQRDALRNYDHYEQLMNSDANGIPYDPSHQGIARELARMNLTLNYYTQWYWKIDLHNLFHFIALRADSHAQYEIRVYAELLLSLIERWVPAATEAFREYRLFSASLSHSALQIVRLLVQGTKPDYETSGLSKREWNELMELMAIPEYRI